MSSPWPAGTPGLLRLPSGRVVRGRRLRAAVDPHPQLGLVLLRGRPPPLPWDVRWVRWPDLGLPTDRAGFTGALVEAHRRAAAERVEVTCAGGRGRTGTALACLAVLDGVPADRAVAWVREHWSPRAVETPWQAAMVRRFAPPAPAPGADAPPAGPST